MLYSDELFCFNQLSSVLIGEGGVVILCRVVVV